MELNLIPKIKGNKKKSKRIGRGVGSGVGGHTVGRGQKGQKSRSGKSIPVGFEGGQVPLYKKIPTIGGFKNPKRRKITTLSLYKLEIFDSNTEITPEKLLEKGVIKRISKDGVKILGNGSISKKLTLKGFLISQSATEKVEKVGGKVLS